MKSLSNDKARHVRVRAFVAYPAVSVALVVFVALALTAFGPSQVMALVAPTPTATVTANVGPTPTETALATASVAPTSTPTPAPTTAAPAPSMTSSPTVEIVVPAETLAPTGRGDGTLYDLVPAAGPIDGTATEPGVAALAAASIVPNIHGPFSMATDKCGICHRTHTAKSRNLLTKPGSQSNLCFACHDGTGANANVKAQFDDPTVPQNDNVKRLYYRHDTAAIAHTRAGDNEYGGVNNRHTECSDCHNPHQARGTDGVPTGTTTARDGTGATASGRQNGVSGVSVVNSLTPNGAPAYTLLDGLSPETSITREYQLCFKCHSGSTVLSSNAGFVPSRYRLDKGIEFNPNNPSYHPIEAPGKNTTPKMAASLAGGTIWKFTTGSTIRCVNCHASSTKYSLVTPPAANGDLPMHTSKNPGILLANYRNRILKPRSEGFRETDFTLCFMCHSKTPFQNQTTTATNFGLHGKHTAQLTGDGDSSVVLIDTQRAGGGNAICAECHFRQHSTSFKDVSLPQTVPGSRLVSFAPNVTGARRWAPGTLGQGTCSLTCHGKSHSNEGYND